MSGSVKFAPAEIDGIRELTRELDTVCVGAGSALPRVLPEIRRLVEADVLLVYCPVERAVGWELERFDFDSSYDLACDFKSRAMRFFASAPPRYGGAFDAARPEASQRERFVDALAVMPEAEYESSRIYQLLLRPMGLHRHRQPRVLLCESQSLLGWFGAFHPEPFDRRQRALLMAFVEPMRRRLQIERQLGAAPGAASMLTTVLDQIGAPAFIITKNARIMHLNAAARALLEQERNETVRVLQDALDPRASATDVQLTPICEPGSAPCWLAIIRSCSVHARTRAAVAEAALRWQLTPRQQEVLTRIVAGDTTAAIAAELNVTERAIELHVTRLFDQAGVDGRAALVAKVLMGG